jgi:capsular polysaccharide biosynthesis protein
VVVLGAQANRIYSHWLLESVLRALLLAPFDDGRVVYLTPPLEPWQQQALALAGVPPERTLTLPRRQLVRFAEVFAVSRGFAQIPALIPDAVQTLRGLLRATVASANRREPADPAEPAGSATTGRRLWVSRRHMERRHISNESQLVEVLAGHGFEVVYPERLGLAEQMAMFARAEAVAGPFGSGLTNLIFSPRGTLVLELQPEDLDFGGNTFLWNLASIREQPFAQVVCPVSEGMRDLPLGERDMTVDVRAINELLGRLLHATQRATAPSTPPQRAWP